jgi:hypothetical protein
VSPFAKEVARLDARHRTGDAIGHSATIANPKGNWPTWPDVPPTSAPVAPASATRFAGETVSAERSYWVQRHPVGPSSARSNETWVQEGLRHRCPGHHQQVSRNLPVEQLEGNADRAPPPVVDPPRCTKEPGGYPEAPVVLALLTNAEQRDHLSIEMSVAGTRIPCRARLVLPVEEPRRERVTPVLEVGELLLGGLVQGDEEQVERRSDLLGAVAGVQMERDVARQRRGRARRNHRAAGPRRRVSPPRERRRTGGPSPSYAVAPPPRALTGVTYGASADR